ncbi:MAG: hypothetical protein JO353_05000 [Phycisphaerae bacterium]|nr:hypothetical protein [Phycisphaerae bacterium]
MLTTVAVLIIVLGLMVSMARYVRNQSANQLTSSVLHRLDMALRQYAAHNNGELPPITPFVPDTGPLPDEAALHRTARENNKEFVAALKPYFAGSRLAARPTTRQGGQMETMGEFGDLPTTIYDEVTLRDTWGDPIVYMPHDHPAIGMASRASPSFFFSAGPDHRYLTRDDNLYSYEAYRAGD